MLIPFDPKGPMAHLRSNLPTQPATLKFRSRFTVQGKDVLPVQFDINSAWPFQLKIDGQEHMPLHVPEHAYRDVITEAAFAPGTYHIELIVHYYPLPEGGVSIGYSYWEDDWRHRKLLGLDTDRVRFRPITSAESSAKR